MHAEFAARYPGVRVTPKRFDWGGEADALREGLVDVAFVWLPNDLSGLRTEVVHSESRLVVLPEGHPLAAGEAICFVPAGMARYYARPGLVWVPMTGAEPLRVALGWVEGSDDPLVERFVTVVREVAEGMHTTTP